MSEHLVDYPFRKQHMSFLDDERGSYTAISWRPGTDITTSGGMGLCCAEDDLPAVADGMGKMVLTEVSRHKPPKPYQERVFYIREWIDPDGKRFGKKTLRIISAPAFSRMLNGYRHEFVVEPVESKKAFRLEDCAEGSGE